MEFPKGRSRKNHVEFPWVLVIFLEIPMGRTHFCGTSQGENLHFVLNFPLFGFVHARFRVQLTIYLMSGN